MAYLTTDEISTHLYPEVVTEINRTDASRLQSAIDAATEEASGYLSAYDVPAILAQTGTARNPTLLLFIKDIAVWHYIQLSNPGVEMELRLSRYEKAIKWLDKVQRGDVTPNLPQLQSQEGEPLKNYFKWGSNPKRQDYFN